MHAPNKPRQRTARACDSCYKRKIKCDSAVPQCNWCSHHDLSCTFDRVVRKRKSHIDGKASRLSERIRHIEQLLADNLTRIPKSSAQELSLVRESPTTSLSHSYIDGNQRPVSPFIAVHFDAGGELGATSFHTGISLLLPDDQEWIQACTGEIISSDKLCPTQAPWYKRPERYSNSPLASLSSNGMFDLPDRRVVYLYFEAYKKSATMQRIFPVVDADLFEETIHAAYQETDSNFAFDQGSTRACIIAFLAFAAILPPVEIHVPHVPVNHDALASKGQVLIAQLFQEPANLHGVQAAIMLTIHGLASGNMRTTNYFRAIAARQLFMVGAHLTNTRTRPVSEQQKKRQQHLRNLFWVCYTLDKDVSFRTGEPPTLADESCDLTLPQGYVDRGFPDPQDDNSPYTEPVFPFELRLSMIKSRVYSYLYSASALQKSDADLLKSIRELDDELEEWRLSLPPRWRPTMSFSPITPDPNVSMHSVMLRLNYYLCMSAIHQASSRCRSCRHHTGMRDGVTSSLALSVEASRSALRYLGAAEHKLIDGVFWTLIFYPMSALLILFCSILQNPLGPHSGDDLNHLRMAIATIEQSFSRRLPDNKSMDLNLVTDFIKELNRLAGCAIDKACREQSTGSVLQP